MVANVEYQNINIKNKKIAFISSNNNNHDYFKLHEIKTLSYQTSDHKFLIIGSIFSSGMLYGDISNLQEIIRI